MKLGGARYRNPPYHSGGEAGLALLLLLIGMLPLRTDARFVANWTDAEMFRKADLVVVASAVSTRRTDEREVLTAMEPPVRVVGMESELDGCIVLKGEPKSTRFLFHYFATDEASTNGPALVGISPDQHSTYLMFLTKERDGRYAPVTGQTDPGLSSVRQLSRATGRRGLVAPGFSPCAIDAGRDNNTHPLDRADVVVIASWVSVKDTDERATLPDSVAPLRLKGVNTQFQAELVLKGVEDISHFTLHHYKLDEHDNAFRGNAPQLITILPPQQRDGVDYPGGGTFLLFLIREPDGRYAPVAGQRDPAASAVLKLTIPVDQ